MWRLLGGELITGLQNLGRWSRHLIPSADRRENGLTT